MEQQIKPLVEESNMTTENGAGRVRKTGPEIVDNYEELIKKIKTSLRTEKLNPLIAEISGIISTGKEETVESIFE